jgi:uncharacterized membrane protein YphA (DoxX/SURF4 family)
VNRILWILQIVFGLYFIAIGVMHFTVPAGLPEQMSWMYDLSDPLHTVTGTLEILGGLGLILPSLTRIRPELTPLAAVGLGLLMLAAAVWHAGRGEPVNIVINVFNAAVLGVIAYGRWRVWPLSSRG